MEGGPLAWWGVGQPGDSHPATGHYGYPVLLSLKQLRSKTDSKTSPDSIWAP